MYIYSIHRLHVQMLVRPLAFPLSYAAGSDPGHGTHTHSTHT